MTTNCRPKKKKKNEKQSFVGTEEKGLLARLAAYAPVSLLALGGAFVVASAALHGPQSPSTKAEAFDWPVAYEEVAQKVEPKEVAEAVPPPSAPDVSAEADPAPRVEQVAPVEQVQEVKPELPKVETVPDQPFTVTFDAANNVLIAKPVVKTPKPKAKPKPKKPKKKKPKAKELNANEIFMENFTRGMY
jgi:hypothetical protein